MSIKYDVCGSNYDSYDMACEDNLLGMVQKYVNVSVGLNFCGMSRNWFLTRVCKFGIG